MEIIRLHWALHTHTRTRPRAHTHTHSENSTEGNTHRWLPPTQSTSSRRLSASGEIRPQRWSWGRKTDSQTSHTARHVLLLIHYMCSICSILDMPRASVLQCLSGFLDLTIWHGRWIRVRHQNNCLASMFFPLLQVNTKSTFWPWLVYLVSQSSTSP